jgi:hypothetical protein
VERRLAWYAGCFGLVPMKKQHYRWLAVNVLLAVSSLWFWWRDGANWITLVAATAMVLAMALVADGRRKTFISVLADEEEAEERRR